MSEGMLMDRPAPVMESASEDESKETLQIQKAQLEHELDLNKAAISAALAAGQLVPDMLTEENARLSREITLSDRQLFELEHPRA